MISYSCSCMCQCLSIHTYTSIPIEIPNLYLRFCTFINSNCRGYDFRSIQRQKMTYPLKLHSHQNYLGRKSYTLSWMRQTLLCKHSLRMAPSRSIKIGGATHLKREWTTTCQLMISFSTRYWLSQRALVYRCISGLISRARLHTTCTLRWQVTLCWIFCRWATSQKIYQGL